MPEVFVKAVSVANNFGHDLDGLVTVNLDKQAMPVAVSGVLERPSTEGIELIGHHEIMLPLMSVACEMAKPAPATDGDRVRRGVKHIEVRIVNCKLHRTSPGGCFQFAICNGRFSICN